MFLAMFTFLPRKVAQAAKRTASSDSTILGPRAESSTLTQTRISEWGAADRKGKEKETTRTSLPEEDQVSLLCLSLSEYSLWSDPDLRRTIASGESGYIPVTYLLRNSPCLTCLDPRPSESALIKSVRMHANDAFDVRMLVSAPSSACWNEVDAGDVDDTGGYEVRRKDWECALQRSRNSSRREWEERTVYMENIPLQFRTVAGIYRFTSILLRRPSSSVSSQAVQSITLPPHHQDRPGDIAKCKGFALVRLDTSEHVELVLNAWPWNPRRSNTPDDDTAEAREGIKFGFRTLSKVRWDALNEEHLAYRQRLLDGIAHTEAAAPTGTVLHAHIRPQSLPRYDDPAADAACSGAAGSSMDPSAPYPPGCLVFVRNVHAETNKTTLRTLFSQAFSASTAGLDYVDFNKGMETCYLRLTTPQHTQLLAEFFKENRKAQTEGLDNTGTTTFSVEQAKPLDVEIVDGTREELYWTKVPEKVRRQAVEKAIVQASHAAASHDDTIALLPAEPSEPRGRKRRKHQ